MPGLWILVWTSPLDNLPQKFQLQRLSLEVPADVGLEQPASERALDGPRMGIVLKLVWRKKRPWPLSPSWGKLQASGTVQRIGLCTQQEFSRCWYWIDGQINCWKCIEKIHTLSTLFRPIFNKIPTQNFIYTYPHISINFSELLQIFFILSTTKFRFYSFFQLQNCHSHILSTSSKNVHGVGSSMSETLCCI